MGENLKRPTLMLRTSSTLASFMWHYVIVIYDAMYLKLLHFWSNTLVFVFDQVRNTNIAANPKDAISQTICIKTNFD
ncbi:hypothetical protein YC2023_119507 [Brassica napus]